MKRFTITICTAAILIACNDEGNSKTADNDTTITTASTTTTTATAEAMPDSATMMKNWETYATPSGPHQMMASWNGSWTGEVSMWMDPSQPPSKSTMTAENKMIMGGRYQQGVNKGSFNGMPFEGMSMLGYDNHKKTFITTWVDNMGTGIMTLEGPWDEASKTIMLKGKSVDPTIGKEVAVRQTFKVIDNDHQLMEMFSQGPDGKEYKSMEIQYTRKK